MAVKGEKESGVKNRKKNKELSYLSIYGSDYFFTHDKLHLQILLQKVIKRSGGVSLGRSFFFIAFALLGELLPSNDKRARINFL